KEANSLILDRAAGHLNLAALEYAEGDLQAARQSLETAIRIEPYLTGPREQLANLLTELGGDAAEIERLREEEIKNLERDADLLPANGEVRYRRGMLLYLLGKPAETRKAFEEACELDPHNYDHWLALALICEAQQDWDRAYEALGYMYELRPKER